MTENIPQGPGLPVPSQSSESRRAALRGLYFPAAPKKKRRWFNIKRKDHKDRAITPDREAVLDAEMRLEQGDDVRKAYDEKKHRRDKNGRFARKGEAGTSAAATVGGHIRPASDDSYEDHPATTAFYEINAKYVPAKHKKDRISGEALPPEMIAFHSDESRGALKSRSVEVVSGRMAKDPEFLAWHKKMMDSQDPSNPDFDDDFDFEQGGEMSTFLSDYDVAGTGWETPAKAAKILSQAYIDQWALSAGGDVPLSLAMQKTAADLFKTSPVTRSDPSLSPEDSSVVHEQTLHSTTMKSFLNACYQQTQSELKKAGITEMPVYRGYNAPAQYLDDKESSALVSALKEGKQATIDVDCNPLTSWTVDEEITDRFTGYLRLMDDSSRTTDQPESGRIYEYQRVSNVPLVLYATVPAERILSIPCTGIGCYNESEVVVIGGSGAKVGARIADTALRDRNDEELIVDVLSGKEHRRSTGGPVVRVFNKKAALYIDEPPNDDWPKRTPDRMSDLKMTKLSKAAMKSIAQSIQDLNTKKLDDLVRAEIRSQAPALTRALRRTIDSLLESKEMRSLVRDLMQGKFDNWQIRLESAARALYVNPKALADALQVPYTQGYFMPQKAMPKTVDYSAQFEKPDILASKWAYSHAGKMITTQTKGVIDTVSQMVTDAMLGDMTVQDLSWELRSIIRLPPRYAAAVRNYRKNLIASGKKVSVANKLAESYAQRLLADHADVIARTEVMTALAQGQAQHWDDMIRTGVLSDKYIRRKWVTSRDERVCEVCGPLDRQTVGYRESFPVRRKGQTFYIETNPAHPRCRCSVVLDVADPLDLLRQKKKS